MMQSSVGFDIHRMISDQIELEGVEQNNLKGFNLKIPKNKLVVFTGMSGSGKSSLAFETLFAEGQRRYVETFTPYARQFFDRMDKPKVEKIHGIPPSIAIEQRNSVKTTRSTVGTMTEITEYLKGIWPHVSRLYCPKCEIEIQDDQPNRIWDGIIEAIEAEKELEILITFRLSLSADLKVEETRSMLRRQGYVRALVQTSEGLEPQRIEALDDSVFSHPEIEIIQDRLKVLPRHKNRFLESSQQAYHFGKNQLYLYQRETGTAKSTKNTYWQSQDSRRFTRSQTCSKCGHKNSPARPALFNFNHPSGACPDCNGFGRIIHIDYRLAIPDQNLSIEEGVVKPWRSGTGLVCLRDLKKFCKRAGIDTRMAFKDLPKSHRKIIIEGEEGYGKKGKENKWPHKWYGIKGYFKWLETKSYKMHVRVMLSKYRVYVPCPTCMGKRLKQDALNYKVPKNSGLIDISEFLGLMAKEAVRMSLGWVENAQQEKSNPIRIAAEEIHRRLVFLNMVGLGYLNLNRATRTLSGGETERVSLASCLGTRLVNTLFVLDEPSVGLHPRDTEKLIKILKSLRDAQNTVVVVEHEASVMKAADRIIDMGPLNGSRGGEVIFEGTYQELCKSKASLTGKYLSGEKNFPGPLSREAKRNKRSPYLTLSKASCNNLRNLTVQIPEQRLVAITGVSGSGKTTLLRKCLIPALAKTGKFPQLVDEAKPDSDVEKLPDDVTSPENESSQCGKISGIGDIDDVLFVDQSTLGKTPRSNPAVYSKAFEPIRKLMAATEEAKSRELNSSAFSFNSSAGQCEKCSGVGYEKIEMQFLSDVYTRCQDCDGKRYRKHILEVYLASEDQSWNISDFLNATIDDAIGFLSNLKQTTNRDKAISCLQPLSEIGLGYLSLGQPINTLSGGENQRLKLVRKLNELQISKNSRARKNKTLKQRKTLFLFDEPTTGLHFEDIRLLIELFQRTVAEGHTIVFIEHNLEMIQSADWVIDLGPEAADQGGELVFCGTPIELAKCNESHTGQALREHFTFTTKHS